MRTEREDGTRPGRERLLVAVLCIVVLAVTNLPYILGYWSSSPDVFGGILLQRGDGYSYLAKMREGWRGELFTLPYTAEPGAPTFLFGYHLALGRLARWTGASVEGVYFLARVLSSILFLVVAHRFIARFVGSPRAAVVAWLMFVFCSGLGWMAMAFGRITSDLWVAEAFPFLTLSSNAHFPLTWAALLWLLGRTLPGLAPPVTTGGLALVGLVVTIQAQVQPLALFTLGLLLGGMVVGRWLSTRRFAAAEWARLLVVGAATTPWFLHAFLVTRTHPILAMWRAQGAELTPPWWNVLMSGGLLLAFAVPGFLFALRRRRAEDQVLIYWAILGILSLYLPGGFQRRLSLGLWMPVVLLAFTGIRETVWRRFPTPWRMTFVAVLLLATTSTNSLVYSYMLAAVRDRDPLAFHSESEEEALRWLAERPGRPLVLASPDISTVIPARTDARVVYGHPAETANAQARRESVESFFAGRASLATVLPDEPVEFVFHGPREKSLGQPDLTGWKEAFRRGDVTIYGH